MREHFESVDTFSFLNELPLDVRTNERLLKVLRELSDIKYALDQTAIVAITDEHGIIVYANSKFCEISQYAVNELLGQNHRIINSGYHPREFFRNMWKKISAGEIWRGEIRNQSKDGSYYWVDTTIVPFVNELGKPYQYVSIRNDITLRKKMEEEIRESENKYRLIAENSSDFIAVVDREGNFFYASPSHLKTLGEDFHHADNLFNWIHEEDRDMVSQRLREVSYAAEAAVVSIEFQIVSSSGECISLETRMNPIFNFSGPDQKILLVSRDITERKKSDQMIYQLAYHDSLTRLPNRRLFMDRLRQEIRKAKQTGLQVAVMFFNLDRFKLLNDTYGQKVGDLILIEAAKRVADNLGSSDLVARMGGDEFTIILTDLSSREKVEAISAKLTEAFRYPFNVEGHSITISCSIGIAVYPEHGASGDELIKRANMALNEVKHKGRNDYSFFSPAMEEQSLERMLLEHELKKAIELEQFHIDYQPKVELSTHRIIGVEALVRWVHPELGLIPPNKFIPVAEESGLIHALGEWVLREACIQNKCWQERGYPPFIVSVNVSTRQFYQSNFANRIKDILELTGLEAQWLEIELTESILSDIDDAVAVLESICKLGVYTSIDDFGTGYSSLSYIKHLPVNTLKIDASFIRDIHQNIESRAIVRAILSIAETLNLNVIAEGVEYKEQLDVLQEEGCKQGQGYLFSKPLSKEDFENYVRDKAE